MCWPPLPGWTVITSEIGYIPKVHPELTEAQQQELERRLAAHTASPEDVAPWEEIKAQALARARR
jgi:hypothetical protein